MDPFAYEIDDKDMDQDQNIEKIVIASNNGEIAYNNPKNKQLKLRKSILKVQNIKSDFLDPNQDIMGQRLSDEMSSNNLAGKRIVFNAVE